MPLKVTVSAVFSGRPTLTPPINRSLLASVAFSALSPLIAPMLSDPTLLSRFTSTVPVAVLVLPARSVT